MLLVGLWAFFSLLALTLLAGVYLAERAGLRRDEPASAPERSARTVVAA